MSPIEIIKSRHSIRAFTTEEIPQNIVSKLNDLVATYNVEAGLSIAPVYNEPNAFGKSRLASYGKFSNTSNYLCIAAPASPDPRILLGYYGEKLVLWLQSMGLGSCWVGLTFSKKNIGFNLDPLDKLYALIAFGFPAEPGRRHKIKAPTAICRDYDSMPQWFRSGVDAALLAPTALNQQKFRFKLLPDGSVKEYTALGPYTRIDMGIARLHFEIGAAPHNVTWAD